MFSFFTTWRPEPAGPRLTSCSAEWGEHPLGLAQKVPTGVVVQWKQTSSAQERIGAASQWGKCRTELPPCAWCVCFFAPSITWSVKSVFSSRMPSWQPPPHPHICIGGDRRPAPRKRHVGWLRGCREGVNNRRLSARPGCMSARWQRGPRRVKCFAGTN